MVINFLSHTGHHVRSNEDYSSNFYLLCLFQNFLVTMTFTCTKIKGGEFLLNTEWALLFQSISLLSGSRIMWGEFNLTARDWLLPFNIGQLRKIINLWHVTIHITIDGSHGENKKYIITRLRIKSRETLRASWLMANEPMMWLQISWNSSNRYKSIYLSNLSNHSDIETLTWK